jgi:hypothetical protein
VLLELGNLVLSVRSHTLAICRLVAGLGSECRGWAVAHT